MKNVAISTAVIGLVAALLLPSVMHGFRDGLELYWITNSEIYLHVIGLGLAVFWGIVWWLPLARRWWVAILAAQWASVWLLATLVVNPFHHHAGWLVALLAIWAAGIVALWMAPALWLMRRPVILMHTK